MKTLLNLVAIHCLLAGSVSAQQLSQSAKNNFCKEAYFQYSVIRSDIYQARMTTYFLSKGLTKMDIDEIFETSSKGNGNFRQLVRATYRICQGNSEYLYLHLHDFLRLTVSDSKELIPYILAVEKSEIEKEHKLTEQQQEKAEKIEKTKQDREVLQFVNSIQTPVNIADLENYISPSFKTIPETLEQINTAIGPSVINQTIAERLWSGISVRGTKFILDGNINCFFPKGKTVPEINLSSIYMSKEVDSTLIKQIAKNLVLSHSVLLISGTREFELDTYALINVKLSLIPVYHYTCYFKKTKKGVGVLQVSVSPKDYKPDLIFGSLSESETKNIRSTLMQKLNSEKYQKGIYKWDVVAYEQSGQIINPLNKLTTETIRKNTCLNLSYKSSIFDENKEYKHIYNN